MYVYVCVCVVQYVCVLEMHFRVCVRYAPVCRRTCGRVCGMCVCVSASVRVCVCVVCVSATNVVWHTQCTCARVRVWHACVWGALCVFLSVRTYVRYAHVGWYCVSVCVSMCGACMCVVHVCVHACEVGTWVGGTYVCV